MKKDKTIFIVDFGLAKEYIDHDTNKHIPYRYSFILILMISSVFIFGLLVCVRTVRYLRVLIGTEVVRCFVCWAGCFLYLEL